MISQVPRGTDFSRSIQPARLTTLPPPSKQSSWRNSTARRAEASSTTSSERLRETGLSETPARHGMRIGANCSTSVRATGLRTSRSSRRAGCLSHSLQNGFSPHRDRARPIADSQMSPPALSTVMTTTGIIRTKITRREFAAGKSLYSSQATPSLK